MALFSVLIPAKGRPVYTRDTVYSVLHQNFDDFDVTLSNNGADPAVKAAVAEFTSDPRFHYIEQPNLLDMPTHWNVASRAVAGDYLLIVSNRSVLKQGTLRKLSKVLTSGSGDIEMASWRWQDYSNGSGVLSPCPSNTGAISCLKAEDELLSFARGAHFMDHVYTLPHAENSCASRSLVKRICDREGHVFRKLIPDFSFAFSCLLNATEVVHFDEPLFILQGIEDSTGVNAIRGDVRPYMDSIGVAEPWKDVPIKAAITHNVIAQDFLAALREYGRGDILAEWNKFFYYMNCYGEIRFKETVGILSTSETDQLRTAVDLALQKEDESVRALVAPPLTRLMVRKAKTLAKIVAARGADILRPNRRVSDSQKSFRTALEAAGFSL